ncbi:unnamed protein product, partial [Polarella glacialis]
MGRLIFLMIYLMMPAACEASQEELAASGCSVLQLSKTLTPQPVAAVVYSIGTGNHSAARLGLQACLSTWASNLPAGALQIIGRGQPAETNY